MISRLKPYFNYQEFLAAFSFNPGAISKFEHAFAKKFKAKYALAFSYGRSALYAILKALDINNSEVIIPAYTCVVVPHAVKLSGNIPKFVDARADDFNLDLDEVLANITKKTRAIIPGNIFGYPVDADKLKKIIGLKDIVIIQDCAHCFGAKWDDKFVCNQGDVAIFSLNISKYISSVFGGIMTTNDSEIYERVKKFRDENFKKSRLRGLKSFFYFLATYLAFNKHLFGIVSNFDYSEGKEFLGNLTRYYDEGKIDLPKDSFENMTNFEAKIGLCQLKKYDEIEKKRKYIFNFYNENLKGLRNIKLPGEHKGATHSHYTILSENREEIIRQMKIEGVQLGRLIDYSIPHMPAYNKYKEKEFVNSLKYSKKALNLPIYPSLSEPDLKRICSSITKILK